MPRAARLLLLLHVAAAALPSLAPSPQSGNPTPSQNADRGVLRRQDTAVPPWLLRGADPETVRALPLDSGAARRGLQSSSDACGYVSVSGSTGQTSFHGLYQATGTCDSKPSYDCLDCSSSGAKIWYLSSTAWVIGTAGCGSTSANIYIFSNEDLEDVTGDWTEAGGGENPAIEITCAASLPPTMAPVPCDYVSVSGSTYQSGRHGLYEATETCDSKPSYECHDCSISGLKIWYHNSNGKWYMGSDGCGSSASGIRIISNDDLEDVSGDWSEWTGSEWLVNSDIAVTCYSYCKEIPGTTDKYRCFNCADASSPASVGDGQCDAANNVSPCWDGGDCCETTCIDGDTHTCGSYDCKDPDAPPVPDPYYPDAAWC